MNKIIYYVASSIDGFISGENEDISGFLADGEGVQKYLKDLKEFRTVIMGRKTYEFGYKFGMKPGAAPYPHMDHFIFSDSFVLENAVDNVHTRKMDIQAIDEIVSNSNTDVYLCGGGLFAGWLLDHKKIDILKLKINPLILGEGVRLFGDSLKNYQLSMLSSESYNDGLVINAYQVNY